MTLRWTTLTLAAVALACASGGCSSRDEIQPMKGGYRTIRAEPFRDTDAARAANEKGLASLQAGDLAGAEKRFRQALTADVEFGPAHNNLGKVHYRQGKLYEAAWEFRNASDLMPQQAEPRNNLGLVLERSGKLDAAVDEYRAALALDSAIEYRANLVRTLLRRGDRTDEVRALLRQVTKEDDRPAWIAWASRQLMRLENAGS